eukprot:Clim_evm18s224 gene=Clim_evmTU18s224
MSSDDENELSLPKAALYNYVQNCVPEEYYVTGDAKDLIMDCCNEFVQLIASEANSQCEKEQRKVIVGKHILAALNALGFEDYVDEVRSSGEEAEKAVKKKKKPLKDPKDIEALRQKQMEYLAAARAKQSLPPMQWGTGSGQPQAPGSAQRPGGNGAGGQ